MSKPMFKFHCKTILFGSCVVRHSASPPNSILGFLRSPNFFTLRLISNSSNQQSFTVSYSINSTGLSPQTALTVSKRVDFETSEKPDEVVNLFTEYGFSQNQLSRIFRKRPELLLADMQKTILPKLDFFEAKGFSCPEIAQMLSVFPTILRSSLDKQIIPSYDFFRSLFQSDEKLNRAIKRCPDILAYKNCGRPNIGILRGYGVPDSNIATMLVYQPRTLLLSLDRFREIVERVVEMGFDASKVNFVIAACALLAMSKSTWESKVDAYKKWGWSEEEVLKAFKKNPWCMMYSEDKLMASMDFFINKMGWTPGFMAKFPIIFGLSLKKRVVPRCSVFQVLLSKGLVEKEVSLNALLVAPEKKFLQKFIVPYNKEALELLKVYKENLNLSNDLLDDKV